MKFNGMARFPARQTSPGPRQPYMEYEQKPSVPQAHSHMHAQLPNTVPGVDYRAYTTFLTQNKYRLERIRRL